MVELDKLPPLMEDGAVPQKEASDDERSALKGAVEAGGE